MNEPKFDAGSLPETEIQEGRGGPAIQERPMWSKVMAGKESWLPATLVGVILTVVAVIAFFFLRMHISVTVAPGALTASLRVTRH